MNQLLDRLAKAEWIAIDTEADSLHAYPEKLCLLQLSFAEGDELIDTLAGLDLAGLLKILHDHELILHGADYDLRLLWRTFKFSPLRIFDTMNAARLLGYQQFGLTHLVQQKLNINLEKGPQKMDWAQRPLTSRMEKYARNDTRYLKPLEDVLRAELLEKGRLSWHTEMCEHLIVDARQSSRDPEQAWRIRGSDRLNPKGLAALKELWRWREEEARQANKPPYFIFAHEKLVALADAIAHSHPVAPLVPLRIGARRKDRLIEAIERAGAITELPEPRRNTGRRLTRQELLRFNQLREKRDKQAHRLGIDATLIASKPILIGIAQAPDQEDAFLMRWQRELLQ